MPDVMRYQVELVEESATVVVSGDLGGESSATLLGVCASLPEHVRTLRLDLRAMGAMSGAALDAVRLLVGQWRDTRRGEFRLSTSHLMATCAPLVAATSNTNRLPSCGGTSDAMTAAYL